MSAQPPSYQTSYTYPQQPNYLLPTPAQNPVWSTSKPVYTIFNKDPLQTIPLKEAFILALPIGALFGVFKAQSVLTTGKDRISHAKALLHSPISAFAGMIFISGSILQCVTLWNFLIERKKRKALGLPTPWWPTLSDLKQSSQASWAGIKSLVSSSATSQ
ncbi:hypothetical protein [Vampirovibrio sp.]|uniref:hypothetical protein n=1 Tax=Vampirovibrio sp. TaxID=2717857 RepID=UPI0035932DAD